MNHLRRLLRDRGWRGRGDAGYSTETVIVIALLAVMALGVVTTITTVVTDKAASITLD
ncbi:MULTISPECIES: hypothetical protein [Streptomonospora]|uniref:Pilus assembly protein n=2 Tax=Streptomonospora TaxID=104204 RepID=A0ABV9SU50_9ACTN